MKILNILHQQNNILCEKVSSNFPLVTIDIQPAYESHINFDIYEFAEMLNNRRGKTLMYVNAEEEGLTEDTIFEIQQWWIEHGVNEEQLQEFEFIDKGYGYIRQPMDMGVAPSDIIRVIRDMFQQRVSDSRELFNEDEDKIIEEYGEENAEWILDGISVNFLSLGKLKAMSPFNICGGSKEQCLREVTLMCDALNIKYKILSQYVF